MLAAEFTSRQCVKQIRCWSLSSAPSLHVVWYQTSDRSIFNISRSGTAIEPVQMFSRLKNAGTWLCQRMYLSLFKGNETGLTSCVSLLTRCSLSFSTGQNQSKVRWCSVLENRPEIIVRRDEGAPTDLVLQQVPVAIWGCECTRWITR